MFREFMTSFCRGIGMLLLLAGFTAGISTFSVASVSAAPPGELTALSAEMDSGRCGFFGCNQGCSGKKISIITVVDGGGFEFCVCNGTQGLIQGIAVGCSPDAILCFVCYCGCDDTHTFCECY